MKKNSNHLLLSKAPLPSSFHTFTSHEKMVHARRAKKSNTGNTTEALPQKPFIGTCKSRPKSPLAFSTLRSCKSIASRLARSEDEKKPLRGIVIEAGLSSFQRTSLLTDKFLALTAIIFFIPLSFGANCARAVTKQFSGGPNGTNTAWGTDANWSPSGIPTSADDVVFNNSLKNPLQNITLGGTSNRVANTLTISLINDFLLQSNASGAGDATLTLTTGNITRTGTTTHAQVIGDGGSQNAIMFLSTSASGFTFANNSASGSFEIRAVVQGDGKTVTTTGAGTTTFTGTNVYTGGTMINGGTMRLDSAGSTTARLARTSNVTVNSGGTLLLANSTNTLSSNRISNAATITLSGGTFNLGGRSEGAAGTAGVGALTLTSTSTIDFGNLAGTNVIQFGAVGSHMAGTLQITNWQGTAGTSGGGDQLLFSGTSSTFMSAYDQDSVMFNGITGYGLYDFGSYYEVFALTAVPEPSTWIAGILAVVAVGYTQRRRLSGSKLRRFRV